MSRAKTQPRDWLADPSQFGREPKPEWRRAATGTLAFAQRRAAQVQHYVVLRIRGRWIEVEERTWAWVAGQSRLPYGALTEMVRGEQHMTFADVIALSRRFGPLLVGSQELRQAAGLVATDEAHWWPGLSGDEEGEEVEDQDHDEDDDDVEEERNE